MCVHAQKPSYNRAHTYSDHERFIAKFRLKLKNEGKTTRPFRCDRNQISYDYTVEVTKRFKGFDPIERVPEELWMEVPNIVQEAMIKSIPKKKKCKQAKWWPEEALQIAEKKKCKQAKWWPEEALQIAEKRREGKGKGEKERYIHLNPEYQRIAGRIRKPSSVINAKK